MKKYIEAQNPVYAQVLAELQSGQKLTHWMWFIFPQIDGLARSDTARYFAIKNTAQALEYLNHPLLGQRLIECTSKVLAIKGRSISHIFSYPDNLKFKSSMTLFAVVSDSPLFQTALDNYFAGEHDPRTLEILAKL